VRVTVPIQISWDLYLGRALVWCECLLAGVRRAVLLPRLDTIFSPVDEDPGRELAYGELDWRLVSPTESDWQHYREMVERQAARFGVQLRVQRVENVARWMGGRQVAVPQFHLWLFREAEVAAAIDRLYDEPSGEERRAMWGWLLEWTAPSSARSSRTMNDPK
jgi:hypothetical protein